MSFLTQNIIMLTGKQAVFSETVLINKHASNVIRKMGKRCFLTLSLLGNGNISNDF